jgi:hypothetical protein
MQFFLSIFTPDAGYHQKSVRENLRLDGFQFRLCTSFNFLATYIFQTATQTFIHLNQKKKKKKKLNLRSCFSFLKVGFTFLNRFRGLTHTKSKVGFFQKLTACLFGARNDCEMISGRPNTVKKRHLLRHCCWWEEEAKRTQRPPIRSSPPSAHSSKEKFKRRAPLFFLKTVYYPLPTCHTQTLTALFGNSV